MTGFKIYLTNVHWASIYARHCTRHWRYKTKFRNLRFSSLWSLWCNEEDNPIIIKLNVSYKQINVIKDNRIKNWKDKRITNWQMFWSAIKSHNREIWHSLKVWGPVSLRKSFLAHGSQTECQSTLEHCSEFTRVPWVYIFKGNRATLDTY